MMTSPNQQQRLLALLDKLYKLSRGDPEAERERNERNQSLNLMRMHGQEHRDIVTLYNNGLIRSPGRAYAMDPTTHWSPLGIYSYEMTRDGEDYMNTNRHLLNDDQANNQSARNRTPKVFIIHGSAKYVAQVEDLCRNWGLVPVTAIDEPNQGKIVVDKILENMENADYRVAILTVDEHTDSGEPSASPNAYMETFVARYMSRDSLAILLEDNVRIPSNLEGMAYIRLDDQWTMKLLEELKAAGLIQVTATRTN